MFSPSCSSGRLDENPVGSKYSACLSTTTFVTAAAAAVDVVTIVVTIAGAALTTTILVAASAREHKTIVRYENDTDRSASVPDS